MSLLATAMKLAPCVIGCGIAKGREQPSRREKIDQSIFQYLARVLIALATAVTLIYLQKSQELTITQKLLLASLHSVVATNCQNQEKRDY